MPKPARFLIADDAPIFRLGAASLLHRPPEWRVCGEAGDRAALLKAVEHLKPDLVVVDLFLEGSSGLDLIGEIHSQRSSAKVLVLAAYDEVLFAERSVRSGAAGYVMKREAPATLVKAVKHVLKGGIFVTPRATGSLLHRLAGHQEKTPSRLQPLSDRELEVLRRLGDGYQSREIAQAMHVSIKTVEAHREHIKKKLDVGSGSELLRLAIQWVRSARK